MVFHVLKRLGPFVRRSIQYQLPQLPPWVNGLGPQNHISAIPSADDENKDPKDSQQANARKRTVLKKNEEKFPRAVRKWCWINAEEVPGRHPGRWRKDPYGNVLCKKQTTTLGLSYFHYDHIHPRSRGGGRCQRELPTFIGISKHLQV